MALDVGGTILGWLFGKGADTGLRLIQGSAEHRALKAAVDAAVATTVDHVDDRVQDVVLAELFRCFDADERPTLAEFGVDPEITRDAIAQRLQHFHLPEHFPTEQADQVDISGLPERITTALREVLRHTDAASGIPGSVRNANHLETLGRFDELSHDLQQLAPSAPVDMAELPCPPGTHNLPWETGLFLGRTEELNSVAGLLDDPGPVVVAAVHGLGGIGKSALARHYASTHRDTHNPAWWITADHHSINDGLAALALRLHPSLLTAVPAEQLPDLALQWLRTHTGWLLILDNVTHPANVPPVLAGISTGRVLITSRCTTGWGRINAVPYNLGVLADEDAEELLCRIVTAENPDADLTGATALCEHLGGLPLAVEQAGAYIAQTHITPDTFAAELHTAPEPAYARTAVGMDSERTIARIWQHTMRHLTTTSPLPETVLGVLSWYAPETIPTALITGLTDLGSETDLRDALGQLAAYSMITHHGDTISVHRLVQTITRTTTPVNTLRSATTAIADALDPEISQPKTWPAYRALLPHIDALNTHTTDEHTTHHTAYLRRLTGRYLLEHGALTRATNYLHQAHIDYERVLGAEHPNTLGSRHNLAYAYESAGRLDQAITLYEAVLADRQRVLGAEHPDTLTSRHNLAYAYESAGRLDQAITLFEAVLADYERVLGAEHPNTLTSRHNLAYAYESAGRLDQAIILYEAVLADYERVLGAEHPNTLTSRNNLAYAYESAGRLDQAITLYEAVLADRQRVLGAEHPNTLASRNNLAGAHHAAGRLDQAITLLEAVLVDYERVLGAEHPDTLASRNNLAGAYHAAGRLDQAIILYEAVLADTERVLGAEHPNTLGSRHNLAYAYESAGRLDQAIALYEAVLADTERVLGAEHPNTLGSRNNLAGAYRAAGSLDQAITLHEELLADTERVLGAEHPNTLGSRHNLAYAYESAGRLDQAITLYEAVLADRQRVLGAEHPDTLTSRHNLAYAYESAGRLDQAITLFEAVLADYERVLGAEHPNTLTSRNNLAGAYRAAGSLDQAITLYKELLADTERVLGAEHPLTKTIQRNARSAQSE